MPADSSALPDSSTAAGRLVRRYLPLLPFLAHVPVVVWVFGDALFHGRVLHFRDVTTLYYPAYVLLDRSFHTGIWPLWNPGNYAGAPFLMANPIELLLVHIGGAAGALRFGPALYLLIAMCGASYLARALSLETRAVWVAGLVYGLSGVLLSMVPLFPLYHAAALAPWVVSAILAASRRPDAARISRLGLLLALQVSTLAVEVVAQTVVLGLVVAAPLPTRRRALALLGGFVLAAAIAAPAILGTWALIADTARGRGFAVSEAFAWSLRPAALLDALLPGFFGNIHTATGKGYWGQPFFTGGFPYFISLYVGPGVLLLAACARGAVPRRLWVLVACGVFLALGSHTPLAWAMRPLMHHIRSPVKFVFLSTLAIALLAAYGVDRSRREAPIRARFWLTLALLLAAAPLILRRWPDLPARLFASLVPEIASPSAHLVTSSAWPASFGMTGALFVCLVLALRTPRLAFCAGAFVACDLLAANGSINLFADASFYELRAPVRRMLEDARSHDASSRWFSFGAEAGTPGLDWVSRLLQPDSDVWLYYLDRQALWPRTNIIDGIDSAFEEDAEGWAPQGASLNTGERVPARFAEYREALRRAGVRWVVSFAPLPESLAVLRNQAPFSEIRLALRLYEIADARPRAYWTANLADGDPVAGDGATVEYERPDAHTVRLRVNGPPGYVHVIEGFDPGWQVDSPQLARPILRSGRRYWAIRTSGNETMTIRYKPRWLAPALISCALGLLSAVTLLVVSLRCPLRRGLAGGA